uniref:GIY-YIG domain-containing protein n=1 Tax=Strongyloides papillosus TaxID=174720 RepID=A0A0N5CDY3_STREA
MNLADIDGYPLIEKKSDLTTTISATGNYQIYCIMVEDSDGDKSIHSLYWGKGVPTRFQDHEDEHHIALNTPFSKYLVMAIFLLQGKKIFIQTTKYNECEKKALQDEGILIRSEMGTWMNIHKRALPGDSRVTEEEKLAHLINLTKNYLGSSYKVVSTSSKTLVIDGEVDANPHQCQICSTVKPSLVALNHHIAFNHTKKGCDSESIDQEMIERIHCYDRRRYQEKTRKMTELELAEFRERQKFHRKKWEERRTEEERIAKIQRNSKMRAERHKAMTEEERSEFNRKARERNQKKREE